VTSQQTEIQYTSTISAPCTLSLADNSGLGVTGWDVNGSLFANANLDLSRPFRLPRGAAPSGRGQTRAPSRQEHLAAG